jgi:hypothetical protein
MITLLLALACAPEPTIIRETYYVYVTDTASDDTGDTAEPTDSGDSGEVFTPPYPDCSNDCYCYLNEYEECQFEIGLDIHDLEWLSSFWEDAQTCATLDESRAPLYECLALALDVDCSDHVAFQAALQLATDCYY